MKAHTDTAVLRGLTLRRVTRRDLFRLAGGAGAGLALSACGLQSDKAPSPRKADPQKFWAGKRKRGHVDFANWPLYMDPKRPELKKFTASTGITVTYKEVIESNDAWFEKIRAPLAAGRSIGYDLMVVTNGIQFSELVDRGFVAPLDHARLPNFTKYAGEKYKKETFDPGNVFSVPWASGMTGIGYNPRYVKTPPTAIADLWDPRYKGKVGMMADIMEVGNFAMLLDGVEPSESGADDWRKAAGRLRSQRDKGIVRDYYDTDYIDRLASGEVWLSMAWSGDIFQQNVSEGTNLKFVLPHEGATLWTDNMLIPKTAKNPVGAIMLMNFFYDPVNATSLTEYINYVTPVPSTRDLIRTDVAKASGDEKQSLEQVADSRLVFPSDHDYANLFSYRTLRDGRERQQYRSIFQPIIDS